jgi:hypothetical protein
VISLLGDLCSSLEHDESRNVPLVEVGTAVESPPPPLLHSNANDANVKAVAHAFLSGWNMMRTWNSIAEIPLLLLLAAACNCSHLTGLGEVAVVGRQLLLVYTARALAAIWLHFLMMMMMMMEG